MKIRKVILKYAAPVVTAVLVGVGNAMAAGTVNSNVQDMADNAQTTFNYAFGIAVAIGTALIVWKWGRKALGR